MIRTHNPVLTPEAFAPGGPYSARTVAEDGPRTMSLQGTVNATVILLGICCATAVLLWSFLQSNPALIFPIWLVGSLTGLIAGLVLYRKPTLSPYIAPLIAVGQGCLAGGASVVYSSWAQRSALTGGLGGTLGPGLVIQASVLTLGIAGALLLAYTSRLIKPTENFKLGLSAAMGGILLVSIGSLVLRLFGVHVPYLWDNGLIGIGFSGFIVVVAALNLVLDFDFIEQGVANNLPKHMEWYAAFGLLVTLVWLYVQILRLLAQLANRRN